MTTRPTIGRPQAWPFPIPSQSRLANGVDVLAFDCPGQHVASVAVVLDTSLASEPTALEGVATLTQRTLDEGTRGLPGESFAAALEDIGGSLDGHVGQDHSVLFLTVPMSRLEPGLELMAESLLNPDFAEGDVERHRGLRLAELDRLASFPAQRAEIAFRRLVLHPSTRAARLTGGSENTVGAIGREDVVAFHARTYRPTQATIVVAGAFAGDPAPVIDRYLSEWTGVREAPTHQQMVGADGGVVLVDRPGSVHADVRLGGLSVDRSDPRWAPLRIATHIVGGEFLSRLNKVLREDRGYTYGVSMTQRPLRHGGTFAVRGSFRADTLGPALAEATEILRVESFTVREVDAAIDYFSGSSALRFATAAGVVGEVASALGSGQDVASIDETLRRYRKVTPDEALAAYRDVVDADRLSLAVVGGAEDLIEPMTVAGYEPTVVSGDEPLR